MEYTKVQSGHSDWYKKLLYLFNRVLTRKQKTYILPTKFGLAYGALCFILLLMGMAYGNNLVYVVCFYLTTMGLALAKITNDHVDKVRIENIFTKEVFAETQQLLFVSIQNTTKNYLKRIEIKIAKEKQSVFIDLKPEELQTVEILWTPGKRGHGIIPNIVLQSSYPADLFRAWKVFKKKQEIIVYPARNGSREFPQSGSNSQDSIGILKEIKDYQPGDSPKRIHWRSLAKSGQVRTLVYEGNEAQLCYFDWQQLQHLDTEKKLEQLSLWISMAESIGFPWHLKLTHSEYKSEDVNGVKLALTELAKWK